MNRNLKIMEIKIFQILINKNNNNLCLWARYKISLKIIRIIKKLIKSRIK